jgi:cold shock protein
MTADSVCKSDVLNHITFIKKLTIQTPIPKCDKARNNFKFVNMKSIKFLILFAFMAVSVFLVKAQGLSKINDANFFKTKFTKEKVWDAKRSPANPVAGTDWTLTGLKVALDASKKSIDWGTGRYLMFVAEVDNAKGPNSLIDDINNNGTKYNISLKLFESNGTLVKVVSTWGRLLGQGDKGFMYEVEGKYGSFFSVADLNASSVVTYKPILAKVSKLSEIISSLELANTTKQNSVVVDNPTINTKEKLHKGTVKFFNEMKGFGYIKDAESGAEYFVHVTNCADKIKENDDVIFYIEEGIKGLNAVNVRLP